MPNFQLFRQSRHIFRNGVRFENLKYTRILRRNFRQTVIDFRNNIQASSSSNS